MTKFYPATKGISRAIDRRWARNFFWSKVRAFFRSIFR